MCSSLRRMCATGAVAAAGLPEAGMALAHRRQRLALRHGDAFAENAGHLVDLLGRHNERRSEDHEIVAAAHQHAAGAGLALDDLARAHALGEARPALAVGDELDPLEEPGAPHIADERVALGK